MWLVRQGVPSAAGFAGVRTEIANLVTRRIRWMVRTVLATATLTVGVLRLFG